MYIDGDLRSLFILSLCDIEQVEHICCVEDQNSLRYDLLYSSHILTSCMVIWISMEGKQLRHSVPSNEENNVVISYVTVIYEHELESNCFLLLCQHLYWYSDIIILH